MRSSRALTITRHVLVIAAAAVGGAALVTVTDAVASGPVDPEPVVTNHTTARPDRPAPGDTWEGMLIGQVIVCPNDTYGDAGVQVYDDVTVIACQ